MHEIDHTLNSLKNPISQVGYGISIVLFHNYISPCGEQPEQGILAYKQNNQLLVV